MNADKEKTVLELTRRNPFWICLAVFLALACDQGFRLAGQLQHLFVAPQLVRHEPARNKQAREIFASRVRQTYVRGGRIAMFARESFYFSGGEARRVSGFLEAQLRIPKFQVFINVVEESENRLLHCDRVKAKS